MGFNSGFKGLRILTFYSTLANKFVAWRIIKFLHFAHTVYSYLFSVCRIKGRTLPRITYYEATWRWIPEEIDLYIASALQR